MDRTLQRAMRIDQKVKRRRVNPLLTFKKHLLQPGKKRRPKRKSRRMRKLSKAVPTGRAVQKFLVKLSSHEIHAKNGKRENDGKIGYPMKPRLPIQQQPNQVKRRKDPQPKRVRRNPASAL